MDSPPPLVTAVGKDDTEVYKFFILGVRGCCSTRLFGCRQVVGKKQQKNERNSSMIEAVYEMIDKRAITPVQCHIARVLQFISCDKQGRNDSQ